MAYAHPNSTTLIILPAYGHFDYVYRTVVSIEKMDQAFRPDYVVIDDASEEWPTIEWHKFPDPDCWKVHFSDRGALTRSWNHGLTLARKYDYKYAVCANTDLLFTATSLERLADAIESGFDLVGPVTNAPGHCLWQDVRPFITEASQARLNDSPQSLSEIEEELKRLEVRPIECAINGFCMAAASATWWNGAFDRESVFNPSFPLESNEIELQNRWYAKGFKKAMVPKSYVFHYRSVSRPEGLLENIARGAFRSLERVF